MTLRLKLLTLYVCVGVTVLALVGGLLSAQLRRDRAEDIGQGITNQLKHLDFALTSFLEEVENDVQALAADPLVRSRDDEEFTSFLDADEETFVYHIGELEQSIIDTLNTFRTTHPYVNSVYMGRENGSFVRSHERERPTQYDPRERPWYVLAKENPGQVMRTEPYPSVTTPDVNLGVVTALVDESGEVFGVVGADVTLANLTDYISAFEIGHEGHMLLVDEKGTILASRDPGLLMTSIEDLLAAQFGNFMDSDQGVLVFETDSGTQYLYSYTSPRLGWKIAAVIPREEIDREIWRSVSVALLGLSLALVLLSVLTLVGLNAFVVNPLRNLNNVALDIARTGSLDRRIEIRSTDELGSLAASFNQMIAAIGEKEGALRASEAELEKHRDHLEDLVIERTAKLDTAVREMAALNRVSRDLVEELDLESLLPTVVQRIAEAVEADRCAVFLFSEEAGVLRARAAYGYMAERLTDFGYRPGEEIVGQAYATGEIQYVPDLDLVPDLPRRNAIRAVLAVPLASPTTGPLGVLSVTSLRPGAFSSGQQQLLETMASQVAGAIEKAKLFEEMQQRVAELETLRRTSLQLSSSLDLAAVLDSIAENALSLVGATNCIIYFYDEVNETLVFGTALWEDGRREAAVKTPRRNGLTAIVAREGRAMVINDAAQHPLYATREARKWGLQAIAGFPLKRGGRVLGVFTIAFLEPHTLSGEELRVLGLLADQAAIAIENARLYQETERHAADLAVLYEVGKEITSTLDLGTRLQTIADAAARMARADKSLILLIDAEEERLTRAVGHGYSREQLNGHTFEEFQDGISGWVLRERAPTLSADIQMDERNRGKALAAARRSGARSAAVAPLLIGDEVMGTLTVVNSQRDKAFTEADLNLVTMLAGQAAVAIQNAWLYQAAQESDRLKSAFLASMSHELRTPLNSIIGFTGIMLQGLVGSLNPEQEKQLNMVYGSARHLLALINDVLDISKIEAGQLEVTSEPFDMRETIKKVVQTVAPLAGKKGLALVTEIAPDVGQITSDRRRVEQILINLVNNGVKFTEDGEVRILCEVSDGWLVIRVVDTGIGIKPEDMGELFKAFRQIDTGVARQHEGTGLGLSICKRLVEMLGGDIWAESEWGVGSTFTFTLPVK
jgi:signal transduction histidine kinase